MAKSIVGVLVLLALGLIWERSRFLQWVQEGEMRIVLVQSHSTLGPHSSYPPLVKTYLDQVLREGPFGSPYVRLTQTGTMKLSPEASEKGFGSVQYFSTITPDFSWAARFHWLPVVDFYICDRLIGLSGDLRARLGGIIQVAHASGEGLLKGELQRFLAELPWNPLAIVNDPELTWEEVSSTEMSVSRTIGEVTARVILQFDSRGLITAVRASDRPREVKGQMIPTPWQGVFSNYSEKGGLLIPLHGEVSWILESGPFTYFKGNIQEYYRP